MKQGVALVVHNTLVVSRLPVLVVAIVAIVAAVFSGSLLRLEFAHASPHLLHGLSVAAQAL